MNSAYLQAKASSASARAQMEFQERMSNTAHTREVKDLQEAGLNPVLSAGGSGASTPSGAAGDYTAVLPLLKKAMNNTGRAISTATQAVQKVTDTESSSQAIGDLTSKAIEDLAHKVKLPSGKSVAYAADRTNDLISQEIGNGALYELGKFFTNSARDLVGNTSIKLGKLGTYKLSNAIDFIDKYLIDQSHENRINSAYNRLFPKLVAEGIVPPMNLTEPDSIYWKTINSSINNDFEDFLNSGLSIEEYRRKRYSEESAKEDHSRKYYLAKRWY